MDLFKPFKTFQPSKSYKAISPNQAFLSSRNQSVFSNCYFCGTYMIGKFTVNLAELL